MRVFRLEKEYDESRNLRYQEVWPVDPDSVDWFDVWSFRCKPRAAVWPPGGALVEVLNPETRPGNFPFLFAGAIGIDPITRNRLQPTFPEHFELLDLRTQARRTYQLVNILDCSDCVDEERSEWYSLPTRPHMSIRRFAFRPERIPGSSLFKAAAAPDDIFVSTGLLPPDRDFKVQCEMLGLRGLCFREVWNDEGNPIATVPR